MPATVARFGSESCAILALHLANKTAAAYKLKAFPWRAGVYRQFLNGGLPRPCPTARAC